MLPLPPRKLPLWVRQVTTHYAKLPLCVRQVTAVPQDAPRRPRLRVRARVGR